MNIIYTESTLNLMVQQGKGELVQELIKSGEFKDLGEVKYIKIKQD